MGGDSSAPPEDRVEGRFSLLPHQIVDAGLQPCPARAT
eukprot:SAG22_NODE_12359_length_445_cov_1.309249_1_plen_37_part_10